ncbi:MAG: DUF3592 domain-containing protein [Firmicutes bacterium]|nr:DUF3592 domain-containing protein [Bacillota bacterium]
MIRLSNVGKLVFFVIFFLAGLFFVIAGFIGIKQADNWPATTGTIQSIELIHEAVDSEDTDQYEVMVEYKVDGKTYVSDLGEKLDDFEVGKVIDILYNPENPDAIILPGKTGSVIGIVVGFLVMIASVFMFLRQLARGV